jgi:uncharacterized protein YdeI (YjbR/CyaY-like superfamily)
LQVVAAPATGFRLSGAGDGAYTGASPREFIMGTKDSRVDAYIEKSAEYARPILKKLRALVHKGCPGITETIKWGMPSFEYKGPFCGMAAFKKHCVFGFWKSALLFDNGKSKSAGKSAKKLNWGAPGRDPVPACITSVKELPSDATIIALVKKAAKLNDDGVKLPRTTTKRKPLPMPKEFAAALKKVKKAAATFEAFPPSHKRDYIEWIIEAKTDETRQRRMATAVEWIAEGKSRNWKYQKA